MLAPVQKTTIQFNDDKQTMSGLRRLVQDLVNVENALNALITLANSETAATDDVPPHVLATTTGLNTDHTVSGLTVGQVLKAISSTNAAFSKLKFSELDGSDITDDPVNGDFIQFVDGFWIAAPGGSGSSSGDNVGAGVGIYANNTGTVLNFRSLVSLGTLAITSAATQIALDIAKQPDQTLLGNIAGLTARPLPLTATQVTAMLNVVTLALKGLVPAPIVSVGDFLRDDLTWASLSGVLLLAPVIWGGNPLSVYGGSIPLDGGAPGTSYAGQQPLDCEDNRAVTP